MAPPALGVAKGARAAIGLGHVQGLVVKRAENVAELHAAGSGKGFGGIPVVFASRCFVLRVSGTGFAHPVRDFLLGQVRMLAPSPELTGPVHYLVNHGSRDFHALVLSRGHVLLKVLHRNHDAGHSAQFKTVFLALDKCSMASTRPSLIFLCD